ncbi:phage tail protein [Photobacterium sp. TLY01]|uniref:phage tail-collar fiber domain-containing protein n=1 Tax=Photobacterium sp. TLY01 TaxID=2907534 RepID=UPI001F2B7D28|nr:phage tail protein [Photobacterium sp. TLY01]UIP28893.1 phage tail protein [Photobacterium sp. TLY01]
MTTPVVQYTKAGLAELISAKNQGIKGAIKWIAAGSRSYTPSAGQTRLYDEKQREPVSDWEDISPTQIRMAAAFKGNKEYEVREVGFFLESGTLLAVYSVPGELLAYKSANASWLQKFTLDISPLPTNSVMVELGTENLNLLITEELATLAAANVSNMARHVGLLFRVMDLENHHG